MDDTIRVFVGWDSREKIAYDVLQHSIQERASRPVLIAPLRIDHIKREYYREFGNQSTQFTYSRFLVPYLCNYEGWAIFVDCDFLCLDDIAKLWDMRDNIYSVQVCKHDYVPKTEKKFLDNVQTNYTMKNWSSLMLFNNEKCRDLTVTKVNEATGMHLHQFNWLSGESYIGSIPKEWNWLVGEYDHKEDVSMVHYTLGGPYFEEYMDCDYADEWFDEYKKMTGVNYG